MPHNRCINANGTSEKMQTGMLLPVQLRAFMQTDATHTMCKFAPMDETQEDIRDFVKALAEKTNLKPSQLATKAGLAPSTLTRFLKGDIKFTPTTRTLNRLRTTFAKEFEELVDVEHTSPKRRYHVFVSFNHDIVEQSHSDLTFYEDLSFRLRLAIETIDRPLEEIASSIQISSETLSGWMNNSGVPSWPHVARLCRRYGITGDWILLGDLRGVPHHTADRWEQALAGKKAPPQAPERQADES